MTGKFVVKPSLAGGIRLNLFAANGQIIATGDVFANLAACLKEMEEIRKAVQTAETEDQTRLPFSPMPLPKFELYRDKAGEFRFRLKGKSGKILLVGEGYKAKANCKKGIRSIVRNAPTAFLENDLP